MAGFAQANQQFRAQQMRSTPELAAPAARGTSAECPIIYHDAILRKAIAGLVSRRPPNSLHLGLFAFFNAYR